MQSWMQLSHGALPALSLAAGALALALLNILDDTEPMEEESPWGDDPAVLAMLSGMSL